MVKIREICFDKFRVLRLKQGLEVPKIC